MKASASFVPRRSARWALLCAAGSVAASILAACGSGASDAAKVVPAPTRLAAAAASASAGGATPPGTTYTVVNLDQGGGSSEAFINAGNQVAYTAFRGSDGVAHAGFFNGDSVREIGAPAASQTLLSGLNDAGQVAGISYDPAGASVGFRWSVAEGIVPLGTLGAATLDPRAINRLGQIAGQAMTLNPGGQVTGGPIATLQPFWRAFFWDRATGARDLGVLAGGGARGFDINDAGTVVGFSGAAGGVDHAFAWSAAGGIKDLGSSDAGYSRAFLINNTGQIAGELAHHGFVWTQATGIVDIGVLGGNFSGIWGMNDAGQVAGASDLACDGCRHAITWSAAEGMVDLGALDTNDIAATAPSFATAINRHGEVVGWAEPGSVSPNYHGFIWIKGQGMIDLNTRIRNAPPGIELTTALAISDSGAIVADSNIGLVLLLPGDKGTDAPLVGPITPDGVVRVHKPIPFAVTFSDRNSGDRHSATWYWNDGCGLDAVSKVQGPGTLRANHTFCREGEFWVTVKVTDSTGRSTTVGRTVMAYGE